MSRSLTVEIYGTGSVNRGAELMAMAIAGRLRAAFPGVRLVVPPMFGSFEARAKHGFWTTWEIPGRIRGRLKSLALRVGSWAGPNMIGIATPHQIDAILDASGFAFSDHWGPRRALALLAHTNGRARVGKPLVLLPQAFGPFLKPETANAMHALARRASVICARDQESLDHLRSLQISTDKVRLYPDFTAGIEPATVEDIRLPEQFVAVVPNANFLLKTDQGEAYLQVLSRTVTRLAQHGIAQVFVIHGGPDDADLAKRICAQVGPYPIIEHGDPRVLKGVLGRARFVVGSRYHALVSALSQGVPCVGIGWAHKYSHLFSDFDCSELLVADWTKCGRVEAVVQELVSESATHVWRRRILQAADKVRRLNDVMWEEVIHLLQTMPR